MCWGGVGRCSVVSDSLRPHGLYSLSGSFVHGTFQARTLEWISIFFSRGSSLTRDWNSVSCVSSIGRGILYHYAACEATYSTLQTNKYDWDRLCPEYTCLLRSTYLEAIQGMRKHQRQWILQWPGASHRGMLSCCMPLRWRARNLKERNRALPCRRYDLCLPQGGSEGLNNFPSHPASVHSDS